MVTLKSDALKQVRQRRYLGRDFDALRSMLLEYARLYHPDNVKDFSEASAGGMFLDFAAYVGDNLSFYLDHQFGELDPETAVETQNIERALRDANVPIVGATPSIVTETFFVRVPAQATGGVTRPMREALPTIHENTIVQAESGTEFILSEDVNFAATKADGTLKADVRIGDRSASGAPINFIVAASGICVSGKQTTEVFSIGSRFVPFRRITLTNPDVTDIISVTDGLGNVYYRVQALTHDVVYRNVLNTSVDSDVVRDALKIVPAPYRFTTEVSLASRQTTLIFGGGSAETLEDDIIPDPTDFAIPMPFSGTFSRVAINPQQLLSTRTLGVAAVDTAVTVVYRHGGGLQHSVGPESIKTIKTSIVSFPGNPPASIASSVKSGIEASNRKHAVGGEDAPSVDELRALIPAMKNSQERIVTREDIMARIYTIPSNFGRPFRAAIRSNPNNPLATQLFIISRDAQSRLVTSPDTLKRNLVTYLNPYRMISDAIDVLDARIVNIAVTFEVVIDPSLNKSAVVQSVLKKLKASFAIKNFHIDQPIVIDDVKSSIFTTPGIVSVSSLLIQNVAGAVGSRTYSDQIHDVESSTKRGIIIPPPGGIFEVRFPDFDITGRAV